MNINLKLLHTFVIAAEKESFKRAADETRRSPSAITMQIRDLEIQLGVQLFLRSPGNVALTPEGRILLEQVKVGLSEIQDGLDTLALAAQDKEQALKIACAPSLSSTRLPNILATFKARHRKVQVTLKELSTVDALELLRAQEIEFFLGPEVADLADFQFEPIAPDPFFACVPASLDTGKAKLALSDLTDRPLIMLAKPTALRGRLDRIANGQGLTLNVQFEVQQATTAIALAAADLGIAIMPRIATMNPSISQLRLVPITDDLATRDIGIVTLKGATPSKNCGLLLKIIRENLNLY
ncbi:MAG: LysR family transcriptional regulator [Pseudomonadota bacterium]